MRTPDEVAAMLRLHNLGWGTRRIAAEVGCNRETVQRYVVAGGWTPCRIPARPGLLAGHTAWIAERLRRHRGNADVVRQELAAELGVVASLRTVERAVSHLRRELAAEALATVRFRDAARSSATDRFRPAPGHYRRVRRQQGVACSWRRSAIRAGSMSRLSRTSGSRRGWRALRGRSSISAVCRASCCSTMPRPWCATMTR